MRGLRTVLVAVCFTAIFCACDSEETSAWEETSTCEPGGACEQNMLNNCTCCSADQSEVEVCQQDKRDACATGRLTISMSTEKCAQNNEAWTSWVNAGHNPCDQTDPNQLQQFCSQKLMGE